MNKKSEICDLATNQKPLVIGLTEFGASNEVRDGELNITGYSLYRGDHSSGTGGLGKGVGLYIHDSLNHSACPIMEKSNFDCSAWTQIKVNNTDILLVGVVYRSPNSTHENNEQLIRIMETTKNIKYSQLVIFGDFNFPNINWKLKSCQDSENSPSIKFLHMMEELDLVQHVTESTRFRGTQNSCLDLVFTNETNMIDTVTALPPIGKSDHMCQVWHVTTEEYIFKNTTRQRYNFRKADWRGFKNELKQIEWDQNESAEALNNHLTAKIQQLKKQYVPLMLPRRNQTKLPWMKNAGIKKQKALRWKKWRTFRRNGFPEDYDAYKMERNRLTQLIRSKKREYERSLILKMKENPSIYHGYCRRNLKTKCGVTNVTNQEGNLTENEKETAEALNKFFHSSFTSDDDKSHPSLPKRTTSSLAEANFSIEDVEEVLSGLDPKKATGPDEVENVILKECHKEIAPIILCIFKKSINTGDVPQNWKMAEIPPIHKGGSKALMNNYRPVALTSNICKALERLICVIMMAFLTTNNLLSNQQHGFVRGRSCQTNLLLCLEEWTKVVDDGDSIDVAYFDYAKAFDKVPHRLLLTKLEAYGIEGKLLQWIKSYLSGRKQRVIVGNSTSSWMNVISGTIQGSVLAFLLFLMYINDLPETCSPPHSKCIMLLADDTKTYERIGTTPEQQKVDQETLQTRINSIAEWADTWRLMLHPEKAKILHIGKNNPCMNYTLNHNPIKTVTEEKDIGLWITDTISTTTQIQKA